MNCIGQYSVILHSIDSSTLDIASWVVWRHILVKNRNISCKRKIMKQIQSDKRFLLNRKLEKIISNSNMEVTTWKKQGSKWGIKECRVFLWKNIIYWWIFIYFLLQKGVKYKHFLKIILCIDEFHPYCKDKFHNKKLISFYTFKCFFVFKLLKNNKRKTWNTLWCGKMMLSQHRSVFSSYIYQ